MKISIEKIAGFMQKQKKVLVELMQIPGIEKYKKIKDIPEYKDFTPESIKKLLGMAKKYANSEQLPRIIESENDIINISNSIQK